QSWRALPGLRLDHDLDVPVQQSKEPQQALGRKAAELVMLQVRDVWLWDAEQRRHLGLCQLAPRNQFVDLHRELDPQLTFAGVGKAKIDEDIATSNFDRFTLSCHNVPRNRPERRWTISISVRAVRTLDGDFF